MNDKTLRFAIRSLRDMADALESFGSSAVGFEISGDEYGVRQSINVAAIKVLETAKTEDEPLPF